MNIIVLRPRHPLAADLHPAARSRAAAAQGKEKVVVLDCVSDLRRIAEVSSFRAQVEAGETEILSVSRSTFDFEDQGVAGLIEQWIADVGDLATAADVVRLEFPPIEDALDFGGGGS